MVSTADSLAPVAAGNEAGTQDGTTASVKGARWGAAAATFLLTPFVGGAGSLLVSQLASGAPSEVPRIDTAPDHAAYREAYIAAYKSAYLPRYRRAVRSSVLITTLLFFAGAAAFSG